MARAGERSHHRGGPLGARAPGGGPHSPRRCSMVLRQESGLEARPGRGRSASARHPGPRREQVALCCWPAPSSPFPEPAWPPPSPDTWGHTRPPMAETKSFLEEDKGLASFPQSEARHRSLHVGQRDPQQGLARQTWVQIRLSLARCEHVRQPGWACPHPHAGAARGLLPGGRRAPRPRRGVPVLVLPGWRHWGSPGSLR